VDLQINQENSDNVQEEKKEEEETDGLTAEEHNEPLVENAQNVNLEEDSILHN